MSEKDKSILIRISQELSDDIEHWAEITGLNKSSFVREGIRHYIENLKSENPELQELIRAIIITKLDKIREEYHKGTIIAFTKVIRVNNALNCTVCYDEKKNVYIVYNIDQHESESMLDAINRYGQKLYTIWKGLPEADQVNFITDLQRDNVWFSIHTGS
ncbi:MAG: hypothetical protein WD355_05210 [Balneolaceae bacterium]